MLVNHTLTLGRLLCTSEYCCVRTWRREKKKSCPCLTGSGPTDARRQSARDSFGPMNCLQRYSLRVVAAFECLSQQRNFKRGRKHWLLHSADVFVRSHRVRVVYARLCEHVARSQRCIIICISTYRHYSGGSLSITYTLEPMSSF